MNAETGLSCPSCGAPLHAGDRFCEQCGARLDEEQEERVGCRACGAPADAIGEDGYCSVCGVRVFAAYVNVLSTHVHVLGRT